MVYLYYANIIGYIRILFLLISVFTAFSHPIATFIFYTLSQALDWIDGPVARYFNQCSEFGANLDMITDRVSDAVILAILVKLYPEWYWFFCLDIILDISSHWYQVSATLLGRQGSHKTATTEWWLLRLYYDNENFMSLLIIGNQLFFMTLYLDYWRQQLWTSSLLTSFNYFVLFVSFLIYMVKKVVSVIQLLSASSKIVAIETKRRQLLGNVKSQ